MNMTSDSKKSNGQIRNFYAGKHVFLTGCTGFYGSLILEKLLRTCTEIGNVYIMTREKKGFSVQERIERFFKKDVFDKLRAINPTFTNKIILIHGDLYQTNLGLSAEDRVRLVKNVNIIIHNASVVYFMAKVSVLLRINVLGTQKMLELAAECPNLIAFVYVSTAYSHHYMNTIEEKFYAPPCGLKMIEDIIRADEENAAGLSKEALNDIIGKWLNQYAFSKAVAESVVEDFAKRSSLPCMIYRPSILTNAIQEPYRGWIDTKNGPAVLAELQAFGLLHVVPAEPGVISDLVPVDLATNGLLSAIWDYAVNRETNEPQVYNCGSSDWNPLSCHTYCTNNIESIEKYPSSKIVWYPFMFLVGNIYVFFVLHVLFHVLPAIVADVVLVIQRKKPKALKVVSKATVHFRALYYFISTSWIIKADKLKSVMIRMDVTDLEEFSFNMTLIDWVEVSEVLALNARKIVKDPIEAIPDARRRFQKLKVLHYIIATSLWILAFFFVFRIIFLLFCY